MGACRAAAGGGDCLIKLFGKTIIPVPDAGDVDKDLQHSGSSTTEPKVQENIPQDSTGSPPQPEVADTEDSSAVKNSSEDRQQQQGDTANQKEKLKKPDKILPCPRCSSMDTKFCYYNNYNINQPRHFCKNCQRYWTAGGAMRNVPVGAGRRKSKSASAASHFLQRVRAALPDDPLCTPIKTVRIDDTDEVARSSIWSLIGIKGDKVGTDDGRGCKLAGVFEPKGEANTETHTVINSLPFLQGNPAALSRAVTFQEGS